MAKEPWLAHHPAEHREDGVAALALTGKPVGARLMPDDLLAQKLAHLGQVTLLDGLEVLTRDVDVLAGHDNTPYASDMEAVRQPVRVWMRGDVRASR